MKPTPLFIAAFFISLSCFWACQGSLGSENNLETPGIPIEYLEAFRIEKEDALEYIEQYQLYINGVKTSLANNEPTAFPNSGEKLVYGARVELSELRTILNASDRLHQVDSLYIMLAVLPKGDDLQTDSTELIFALNSPQDSLEPWKFFDFTMPCPNACPKLIE